MSEIKKESVPERISHLQPYPTAEEERDLWKRYLKWRRIEEISGPEISGHKAAEPELIIEGIIEGIKGSNDLIEALRESDNPCRLQDLFGPAFIEIINNAAFGRGNPLLIERNERETNPGRIDIKTKIYELAINRELLPNSIMELIDAETPVIEIPRRTDDIRQNLFRAEFLTSYKIFIDQIQTDGGKARNRIVETHLKLVENRIRSLTAINYGLTDEDLFQEGAIGLIKASEHFNPAYGERFMSFAQWWVRQAVDRAIADKDRIIRIPVHVVETVDKIAQVRRQLSQENGREPTIEEIATELKMAAVKVERIIKMARWPIWIDINGGDNYLHDPTADPSQPERSEPGYQRRLKEQMTTILSTLTPQEERIIELRFGLIDGRGRTLEVIGQEFGLTRERIRQLEIKALRKLRHPRRSSLLRDYL